MKNESVYSCGCIILVLLFNLAIGGWSVNYLLDFFLDKDIPIIGDVLIGLFVAEFSVPVAIVIAMLQFVGVL